MLISLLLSTLAAAAEPPADLDAFLDWSRRTGSNALYVERAGEVLVDWHRGSTRPMQAMSMTKSIVGLLVGRLRDEGRIASFDEPLSTWFPEIVDPELARTPLRAVLEMRTGIEPCAIRPSCDNTADVVGFALRSPRPTPLGVWEYNNNAVNLLTGLIGRVTGGSAERYAQGVLFGPLGITDARWDEDEQGTNFASDALYLSAGDLVRIGQMMLAGGTWDGARVLERATLDELTSPQAQHPWNGLLWWPVYVPWRVHVSDALLDYALARGVDPGSIALLRPLAGRTWATWEEGRDAAVGALGGGAVGEDRWRTFAFRSWTYEGDPRPVGYAALGYGGQFLVVLPELGVVAVRQRRLGFVYTERDDDPRDLDRWPERLAAAFLAAPE